MSRLGTITCFGSITITNFVVLHRVHGLFAHAVMGRSRAGLEARPRRSLPLAGVVAWRLTLRRARRRPGSRRRSGSWRRGLGHLIPWAFPPGKRSPGKGFFAYPRIPERHSAGRHVLAR